MTSRIENDQQRAAKSREAMTRLSEGILKAVEIYEASYDRDASRDAIETARTHELNEHKPLLIHFRNFYRKSLRAACEEADAELHTVLFGLLSTRWISAIEMAEDHIDDMNVE